MRALELLIGPGRGSPGGRAEPPPHHADEDVVLAQFSVDHVLGIHANVRPCIRLPANRLEREQRCDSAPQSSTITVTRSRSSATSPGEATNTRSFCKMLLRSGSQPSRSDLGHHRKAGCHAARRRARDSGRAVGRVSPSAAPGGRHTARACGFGRRCLRLSLRIGTELRSFASETASDGPRRTAAGRVRRWLTPGVGI
jgi:hypothetical protein